MEIRFHLDENVNNAVANGLKLRGIDVTTPKDVDLIGASDSKQLEFANKNERVLVTHDDDLIRLAASGKPHSGIAYCHQRQNTIGQNVLSLFHLWRTMTVQDMKGRVEFL